MNVILETSHAINAGYMADQDKARDIYARYGRIMAWARDRYKDKTTGGIVTYRGNVPTRYTLIVNAAWSRCLARLAELPQKESA